MACIYKITNLINGKTYIGQSKSINTHYYGSGQLIKRAVRKYGKKNFKKEIVVQGDFSKEHLNELEKHYIRLYSPHETENSYNLTAGGEGQLGWVPTEKTKKNMSKAAKRRMENPLERIKAGNGSRGRKISMPHQEALRKAILGNKWNVGKKRSPESIEKGASKRRGCTFTKEQKERMSKGRLGMKFTEERRKKLSLIKLGKRVWDNRRKIIQTNPITEETIEFSSIREAIEATKICKTSIERGLKHTKNGNLHYVAKGFIWKYKE